MEGRTGDAQIGEPAPGRMRPEEVEVVIYHFNCADGFASAHCARDYARRAGARGRVQAIVFLPGIHKRPPQRRWLRPGLR